MEKFEMVDVDFGVDVQREIEHYLWEQIGNLEKSHDDLHKNLIPKWRRLYLGTPAEKSKNFPFPNAANTVVQVVGETVDTMVARVMGLIYATHPLFVFENYVRSQDMQEMKDAEVRRRVIEDYMDLVGMEPSELDLQRVEAQWFTDASKLGTAFVKLSMDEAEEAVVVGYESGARKRIKAKEQVKRSGPRVTKLRHEDVMADGKAQTLDDANMVVVRCALTRFQLEEREFTGAYDGEAVKKVMVTPDRSQPREGQREELQEQGISSPASPDTTAEWDIYECYFPWWHNKRKYRLIYSYHLRSRTVMRKVFNFLPNNALSVKRAKLGYRTDGLYGHGYAELLDGYQEELSTTHNQRLDNATVANVRALRVSPRARTLDSNIELYPSALLVGEKDDIEAIQVGDVYPSTFKNEEMTLQLVARRASISPSIAGSGSGGMMKKPAVYSAQGTLAVMQESNSVVGFVTSEFRHAHVILGAALVGMYAKFGTGGKEQMFGLDARLLDAAFREFEQEKMRIPIRAASASLNREVEKQSGMLLQKLMQAHYTAIGQLMQAIANPTIPPEVKDYFIRVIQSADMFHKKILKDFGYGQPELYVPEPQLKQEGSAAAAQGQGGEGGMAPGGSPMAGAGPAATGGGGPMVPSPGMGSGAGGIAPPAGAGPRS